MHKVPIIFKKRNWNVNLIFSYLCREANAIFRLLTQCIIYLFYDMTKAILLNNKSESPVNFLHLLTTLTAYFFSNFLSPKQHFSYQWSLWNEFGFLPIRKLRLKSETRELAFSRWLCFFSTEITGVQTEVIVDICPVILYHVTLSKQSMCPFESLQNGF